MNKKLFILPIVLLLALSGCKGKKNGNKKGDVINDLVLKANTKVDKKYIFSNFDLVNKALPVENISVVNVLGAPGFLEIVDTAAKKHYYSIVKGEVICSTTSGTVRTFPSSLAGGFISVTEDGRTSVYDALGNTLVKDNEQTIDTLEALDYIEPTSGTAAAHIIINQRHQYFVYDANGLASLTLTLVNGDSDYEQGSSLQGITYESLDNYGHIGYKKFKSSGRYVIFDSSNNEVASFTDPTCDTEFFVGDYLIYQTSVKLDDNNNSYDYIDPSGDRYSLETYRINYLTAKKEAIDVKYVLGTNENDIKPFFNDKGVYSYSYANLRTISDKKILSNTTETYIIDGAGALHDNVTGISLGSFVRFGNNYYNTASKTIYDGYLNEISILDGLQPEFVTNAELIICQKDGNFGAVNHEGKIAIPFDYEKIYTNYLTDHYLLAMRNGVLYKITFDARQCVISQVKPLEGYNSVSYVNAETVGLNGINNGAAIYCISGSATSGQAYGNYLSLLSDTPINIQSDATSVMTTKISTAEAINKSVFGKLELASGTYTYYNSNIAISH